MENPFDSMFKSSIFVGAFSENAFESGIRPSPELPVRIKVSSQDKYLTVHEQICYYEPQDC